MALESGGAPDISQIHSTVGVAATAATAVDPVVYMGYTVQEMGDSGREQPGSHASKIMTQDQAVAQFYSWSDEERSQWGKRLYTMGVLKDPNDWNGMLNYWADAVKQSANLYSYGGKPVTPWDFVTMQQKNAAPGANYNGPVTHTTHDTSVNLPSESDAQAAIKTLFKEQLGRDPEDGELSRYTSMMMAKFKAHPQSTTTTTTTDPGKGGKDGGSTTSSSTSTGAYNPQVDLQDAVQADPEWGAYQAATTYYNALQGALAAPA